MVPQQFRIALFEMGIALWQFEIVLFEKEIAENERKTHKPPSLGGENK